MISPLCVVDMEVFINEKVKVTMWNEKVKVIISPLCVVDIEVFTDEEAKGAESAKDEQQEGREELQKSVRFIC